MITFAEKNQMGKRIEFIDALKGFAIFCVLWGHSLQDLRNEADFFHNQVFAFIYAFHMPLFFMISGFFFASSLKLGYKEFLLKKSKQLLFPSLIWTVFYVLLDLAERIYHHDTNYMMSLHLLIPSYHPLWFLTELFISYLLVYVCMKIAKKAWVACLLSIVFVLFAPYCRFQNFLLPFFWIGIYLKRNYQVIATFSTKILAIAGVLFVVCLLFWNGDYTIYQSPLILFKIRTLTYNFSNIDIALFRFFTGMTGSVFWLMLFHKIYQGNRYFSVLSTVGTYTLGIYILQKIILETLINRMLDFSDVNIYIYNFLITPLMAVFVCAICIVLMKFISKNKFCSLVLLGK
jgi:fucose 4-O-acetylase-like acetyltransferase